MVTAGGEVGNDFGGVMPRRFDHIDLRVRSLGEVGAFYRRLLPALGFRRDISTGPWLEFQSGGTGEVAEFFGIVESPDHAPNVFFEDPGGTRLEICQRRRSARWLSAE